MSAQPSSFLGDWLVSEYLYTPAGEYAGVIHQHRRLQPQGAVVRVIQTCQPVQAARKLSPQAQEVVEIMNRRAGEFVFDLQPSGQARHYLGPDVIGSGFLWHEGVLTARGLWPRFGYNFTSFSILLNPTRQITGGKFFQASQQIATLLGVAGPESEGFPTLSAISSSEQHSGICQFFSPEGQLVDSLTVTSAELDEIRNNMPGNFKRYGALIELEAASPSGEIVSAIEISDQHTAQVAGIWKIFQDEKLKQVQIYVLSSDNPRLPLKATTQQPAGGHQEME